MVLVYCNDDNNIEKTRYAVITLDHSIRILRSLESVPAIPEDCDDNNFGEALEFAEHYMSLPIVDAGLPTSINYSCYLEHWESVLKHIFLKLSPLEEACLLHLSCKGNPEQGRLYKVYSSDSHCFGRGNVSYAGDIQEVLYLKPLDLSRLEILERGVMIPLSVLIAYHIKVIC